MGAAQKLLLSLSDSFAESYLHSEQIDRFIQKESHILFQKLVQNGVETFSSREQEILLRINQRMPVLNVDMSPVELKIEEKEITAEEFETWQADLEKGRVINKGVLKTESAVMLLSILDSTDRKVSEFLEENMELLLRHVEVKREQALKKYTEPLSKKAGWEERCKVGMLFSAFAGQNKDWRFLNGALKLNEWLWKEYYRPFSGLSSLPLLATLVEQEVVFKELQSC